jgi:hypothetical protein
MDHISFHCCLKIKVKWSRHHAINTYWGSGGTDPYVLDLGTRWRWVVSFTRRQFYPQRNNPPYHLDRRLGGPQSRSGRSGEEKKSQPPPRIEPQNPDRPARSQSLYRLNYHGSCCYLLISSKKSTTFAFSSTKGPKSQIRCIADTNFLFQDYLHYWDKGCFSLYFFKHSAHENSEKQGYWDLHFPVSAQKRNCPVTTLTYTADKQLYIKLCSCCCGFLTILRASVLMH